VSHVTASFFFSVHVVLPFVLGLVIGFHLACLHVSGSTGITLGLHHNLKVRFSYVFAFKDLLSLVFVVTLFAFVLLFPLVLGSSDNNIPANVLASPLHILPE